LRDVLVLGVRLEPPVNAGVVVVVEAEPDRVHQLVTPVAHSPFGHLSRFRAIGFAVAAAG
jgi:hypothetical protein